MSDMYRVRFHANGFDGVTDFAVYIAPTTTLPISNDLSSDALREQAPDRIASWPGDFWIEMLEPLSPNPDCEHWNPGNDFCVRCGYDLNPPAVEPVVLTSADDRNANPDPARTVEVRRSAHGGLNFTITLTEPGTITGYIPPDTPLCLHVYAETGEALSRESEPVTCVDTENYPDA